MIRAYGGSFLPSKPGLAIAAVVSGLMLAAPAASAQDTVIIGGSGRPSVEVNLDVLNDLGPGGIQGRRLRMPGETAPLGAIVLRPPGGLPTARAAPAPTLRPPRPAQPPAQAARPAPPSAQVARPAPPLPPPAQGALPPAAAVETTAAPPPLPPARTAAVEEEPAAAPAARETQTAAVAPRAALPEGGGLAMHVIFSGSSTRVTNDAGAELDRLAEALLQTEDRIQLKAFAGGTADRPSTARRLSLSRALSVRSHLIEKGLRSTRIDVRALGVPGDGGPNDRVDVILLTQ